MCSCWILGGKIKGRIRDVGFPILMGIGIFLSTKSLIAGVISIVTFQIIRLGYGNYELGEKNSFLGDLTKDSQGRWIRTIYGGIVALVGCGALFALKFVSLPLYFAYFLGNAIIGYSVSKFRLPVLLADLAISWGFGSLLLWVG